MPIKAGKERRKKKLKKQTRVSKAARLRMDDDSVFAFDCFVPSRFVFSFSSFSGPFSLSLCCCCCCYH